MARRGSAGAGDAEQSYLALEPEAGRPMDDLIGDSITYRVAVSLRAGQKVLALQPVPPTGEGEGRAGVAQYACFSLHAGTVLEGEERTKLERLALTAQGHLRYRLKRPYRDGTTQVVLEPLDFWRVSRLPA